MKILRRVGELLLNIIAVASFTIGYITYGLGYLFVFIWIPFSPLFAR